MNDWFKFGYLQEEFGGKDGSVGSPGPPGIGFKLSLDGNYDIQKKKLVNLKEPDNKYDAANKFYVDSHGDIIIEEIMGSVNHCLKLNSSDVYDASNKNITNVKNPTLESHVVNKIYLDSENNKLSSKLENSQKTSKEHTESEIKKLSAKTLQFDPKTSYISLSKKRLIGLQDPIEPDSAANKKYVDNKLFNYDCKGNKLINVGNPTENTDAANKLYVNENIFNYDCKNNKLINLLDPTEPTDSCTKKYVDKSLDNLDVPFCATMKKVMLIDHTKPTIIFDKFTGSTNNVFISSNNNIKIKFNRPLLVEVFVRIDNEKVRYVHLDLYNGTNVILSDKRLNTNPDRMIYHSEMIDGKKGEEIIIFLKPEFSTTCVPFLRISTPFTHFEFEKNYSLSRAPTQEDLNLQLDRLNTIENTSKSQNIQIILNRENISKNKSSIDTINDNRTKEISTINDKVSKLDLEQTNIKNKALTDESNISKNKLEIDTINEKYTKEIGSINEKISTLDLEQILIKNKAFIGGSDKNIEIQNDIGSINDKLNKFELEQLHIKNDARNKDSKIEDMTHQLSTLNSFSATTSNYIRTLDDNMTNCLNRLDKLEKTLAVTLGDRT